MATPTAEMGWPVGVVYNVVPLVTGTISVSSNVVPWNRVNVIVPVALVLPANTAVSLRTMDGVFSGTMTGLGVVASDTAGTQRSSSISRLGVQPRAARSGR